MVATLADGEKKHDDLKAWLDYESGVTPKVGQHTLLAWLDYQPDAGPRIWQRGHFVDACWLCPYLRSSGKLALRADWRCCGPSCPGPLACIMRPVAHAPLRSNALVTIILSVMRSYLRVSR